MNKTWYYVLLGVLVLIIGINVVNFLGRHKEENPDSARQRHLANAKKIPSFSVKDSRGDVIDTAWFKGKNVYFQFIYPEDSDDIEVFDEVYKNFEGENLEIVIFTPDAESLLSKISVNENRVHVVSEKLKELQHAFAIPAKAGVFFVYDSSGKRVAAGRTQYGYESGPKTYLKKALFDESFNITEFIPADNSLEDAQWLSQMSDIIANAPSTKKVFIFALFYNLCDQCGGGKILHMLKKLYSVYPDVIDVSLFSFTHYTEKDIEVLSSQAQLIFPLLNGNDGLRDKWDDLIGQFNRANVDNIVFTCDTSGKVLAVLYPKCKCFKSFFSITESIIKERQK